MPDDKSFVSIFIVALIPAVISFTIPAKPRKKVTFLDSYRHFDMETGNG